MGIDIQPYRAGLTFGGRPSGPPGVEFCGFNLVLTQTLQPPRFFYCNEGVGWPIQASFWLEWQGAIQSGPSGGLVRTFCGPTFLAPLLRSRLHGKRLLVNTGLDFRNRAIVDRYLFRLSLEHKAMAHP